MKSRQRSGKDFVKAQVGFRAARLPKGRAALVFALLAAATALTGETAFAVGLPSTIVTFDTSGNTAAQSVAATFNATQQASGVSGTPQLSRTTLTASGGAGGSFFSNGNGNNTNTFLFNSSYVSFAVTPTAGNVLYATSISFNSQGDSTSPNSYGIAYSTDNFNNFVGSSFYTGATSTASTVRSYDIPDLITNDTLSVRLSNYGATSIGGGAASANGSFQVISPAVTGITSAATANIALAASANTEVRVSTTTLTLSGVISGNFSSITKTGAGTLILTGQNTLGATNATSIFVNAGTLLGNNNPAGGSFAGAGNIQVGAAGTLGGTGSTGGTVTVANGGTISPGSGVGSVGTLSIGALTLSDTANMVFDLGGVGASDQVNIFGGLTLDGKLTVNALSGFGIGQYVLYTTAGAITNNTVDVIDAPAGYNYAITINSSSVYLNVTAVPEPATVLGGLLMIGALGWNQRRRVRGWAAPGRTLTAKREA